MLSGGDTCGVTDGDAVINMPEPPPTGPVWEQVYRYRGESVSIGGAMDLIIRVLAEEYAGSDDPRLDTSRRWDEVKRCLRERGLTNGLQPELEAIAEYFKVRRLAAHGAIFVAQVGTDSSIFRVWYDGPTFQSDQVRIEDLKREAAMARKGYEVCRAVGRALDDDQPAVLAGMNQIRRFMLMACCRTF